MEKFAVILADPPWEFRMYNKKTAPGRGQGDYYPTMQIDSLCSLPVESLAADDCALFMWATFPTLPEAIKLGEAWGFEYKTAAFVWVKQTPRSSGWFTGMGYWTRANTEPCLLFTRGNPKRVDKGVKQILVDEAAYPLPLVAPVSTHSRKPSQVYDGITRLMGDVPRIELFARNEQPGWVSVGNEIDGKDISEAIAEMR